MGKDGSKSGFFVTEHDVTLAAIGGIASAVEAAQIESGDHPLYSSADQLHKATGEFANFGTSPGLDLPSAVASKAKRSPGVGYAWNARRPFTHKVMEVAPSAASAPYAIGQELVGKGANSKLASAAGFVAGLDHRLTKEVPIHMKGNRQRGPEGLASQYELARFDHAVESGMLKGKVLGEDARLWRKFRSGASLTPDEMGTLGTAVVGFSKSVAWNASPELSISKNPLVGLSSLNADAPTPTADGENRYDSTFKVISFDQKADPVSAFAPRLDRLLGNNEPALIELMASNITTAFRRLEFPTASKKTINSPQELLDLDPNPILITQVEAAVGFPLPDVSPKAFEAVKAAYAQAALQMAGPEASPLWPSEVATQLEKNPPLVYGELERILLGEFSGIPLAGEEGLEMAPELRMDPAKFGQAESDDDMTITSSGAGWTVRAPAHRAGDMRGLYKTPGNIWRPVAPMKIESATATSPGHRGYGSTPPPAWVEPGFHLIANVKASSLSAAAHQAAAARLQHQGIRSQVTEVARFVEVDEDGSSTPQAGASFMFETAADLRQAAVVMTAEGTYKTPVSMTAYMSGATEGPEGFNPAFETRYVDSNGQFLAEFQAKPGASAASVPAFTTSPVSKPGLMSLNRRAYGGLVTVDENRENVLLTSKESEGIRTSLSLYRDGEKLKTTGYLIDMTPGQLPALTILADGAPDPEVEGHPYLVKVTGQRGAKIKLFMDEDGTVVGDQFAGEVKSLVRRLGIRGKISIGGWS